LPGEPAAVPEEAAAAALEALVAAVEGLGLLDVAAATEAGGGGDEVAELAPLQPAVASRRTPRRRG
jgi:hypothetical protein